MDIHSLRPFLPYIPDDLTVGQFVFDAAHPTRPRGKEEAAWIVEDATGRALGKQEVTSFFLLSNILSLRLQLL
jgi:hypothetical protein